jgi:hypothetical protein
MYIRFKVFKRFCCHLFIVYVSRSVFGYFVVVYLMVLTECTRHRTTTCTILLLNYEAQVKAWAFRRRLPPGQTAAHRRPTIECLLSAAIQ